jgi:hypothetical protein
MTRRRLLLCAMCLFGFAQVATAGGQAAAGAQNVSLEYQVKAAYLFNFAKFVEWPASAFAGQSPLTICVAGSNPFGAALGDLVKGETVHGRPIVARVVDGAGSLCHVLFVPRGEQLASFVRSGSKAPVLTVGETADFLEQGGIVSFVLEEGRVRFEMSPEAANRHGLMISSRLLRLARVRDSEARP